MDDLARYQAEARDYLNAVFLLKSMQKLGLLSEKDYVVAEKAMAKKHSIKTGSVYRLYGLNTQSKRAMYVMKGGLQNG